MWSPEAGVSLALAGGAYGRGRAQAAAAPARVGEVRAATRARLARADRDGLLDAAARDYLARQRAFQEQADPQGLAEVAGIADGFGLSPDEIYAHLHLGVLADLKLTAASAGDGCSAWAVGEGPDGPLAVKNRDFHGSHAVLQQVFLHDDPAWRGGRALCLGSLGSPGAYSSGINAHGLALIDTQVGTRDHGIGLLRYFLMTRLLAYCRTVDEALREIAGEAHAGGGTLVLTDAGGDVVAVELGHCALGVERAKTVWRTNHFVSQALGGAWLASPGDAMAASSRARFAYMGGVLQGRSRWSAAEAAALMAFHGGAASPDGALCRHGEDGAARTLSTAIFACAAKTLYLAAGNPCAGAWTVHALEEEETVPGAA